MPKIDLTNQRFGKLLVLNEVASINKRRRWFCRCDCGTEFDVLQSSLRKGATISCGCRKKYLGQNNPNWTGYAEITGSQFANIQNNAKNRHHVFELSIQDLWELYLKQGRVCSLTGIPLYFSESYNRNLKYSIREQTNASLDRIDSSVGYIHGNVQWIHKDVNLMKNKFSQPYFLDICRQVVGYSLR